MKELITAEQFAINAHKNTNHFYDTYLPYEFHLRMVVKVCNDFKNLLPSHEHKPIEAACWLHDTIEDCRVNYGEIKEKFGQGIAEIVRACTNYTRGRNRLERMPDECYNDLRDINGAIFVKLCDRIANVQYSKMTGSSMFRKYKSEHANFKEKLYDASTTLSRMWEYLDELFKS